jgi:hypothetical protein
MLPSGTRFVALLLLFTISTFANSCLAQDLKIPDGVVFEKGIE